VRGIDSRAPQEHAAYDNGARDERSDTMTSMTPQAVAAPEGSAVAPIALAVGEGEALWAFGALITVKASTESTGGRVAVLEHLAGRGAGSPLHVHHREDEWFYVMEGELTFWVGGEVIDAPAGSFVYGPRDVPHTFTVSSEEARFLLVTEPAGLEGMLRALGEPAGSLTIPPPPSEPPDMERIVQVCADHGIEILGPPGIPA
jgi:mannose-6-phosphate isomerase-like protein (cupin superfamily)